MNAEPLQLVLAADSRYAMPLAVAIASAAAHADRSRSLVVHVIHSGFGSRLRTRVERSLQRSGHPAARIAWIALDPARLAHLPVVHHYMSPLIYARLLIPELLPPSLDKALYIDADTVVCDDLAILWDTDLQGRALAAVRDRIGTLGAPGGLSQHAALGLPADAPYFNSGVLLIDLARWRAEAIAAHVFAYLHAHRATLRMGDQDGLNALLCHDWHELPFRWNWQTVPRMHRDDPAGCWGPRHVADGGCGLLHFSTSEKPWLAGCQVAERQRFFDALDGTDWAGWRVPAWREGWLRTKRALRRVQRGVGLRPPRVAA